MLRRKPTRIELKLDDIEEYEQLKKERELEKKSSQVQHLIISNNYCSV